MARGLLAPVALALALAPLLARGQGPVAAEGAKPEPPPGTEPAAASPPGGTASPAAAGEPAPPPPAAPVPEAVPAEPGFVDASHQALEQGLGDVVDWLDRIFGDRRFLEFGPPSSTVRWRSELRLTDEPHVYPHTTALVDLRLPAAQAWLSRAHLVLSGEREPTGAPGDPGLVTELAASQGRLELRLDLLRRPRTFLYLGGGITLAWPPEPFARLRLRQDLPLTASLLARFTPTAFWEERQGFGGTAQLDLDQALSPTALVRASGAALASERSRGLEWGTSLELRGHLSERLLGALGGSMSGAERSAAIVEQYRVFARLRREVLRRWVFLELEPEAVWQADPAAGYRQVLGVILRLEVLFVGESPAAKAPPPAGAVPPATPAAPAAAPAAAPPPPATPPGAAPEPPWP